MRNALTVARIQTINAPFTLGMPWSILGSAFAINLLVFGLIDVPEDSRVTGALVSIYIFALVANLQAMTQMFPHALGLGRTRRAFLGGTAVFVAGQAVLNGILMTLLLAVERATDGWGMGLAFFGVPFLVQSNPVSQIAAYAAPYLFAAACGLAVGIVFQRWGQSGMLVLTVASILGFGGLAALVTWQGWWDEIGAFFAQTSTLLLTGLYPAVLALGLGGFTYALLRRATV